MKLRKRLKLNMEIPTSSQSDIAFLLIIFFIVTAIFFERTGIIFKLPKKSSKTITLQSKEFIKVKMFNDRIFINKRKLSYSKFYNTLEQIKEKTDKNIVILYFHKNLEYKRFIQVFQDIKKIGNLKISIKTMR